MRKRVTVIGIELPTFECEADTAAEAINAFSRQNNLRPIPGQHRIRYKVLGHDSFESLYDKKREDEEIILVPAILGGGGGKNGGIMQIVLGVILIVVGAVMMYFNAPMGSSVLMMGISMLLGGILTLMSPAPKTDSDTEDVEASRYLGPPKNTVKIGTRIPIAYGENKVFGHYLSFNIQAVDSALTPASSEAGREVYQGPPIEFDYDLGNGPNNPGPGNNSNPGVGDNPGDPGDTG